MLFGELHTTISDGQGGAPIFRVQPKTMLYANFVSTLILLLEGPIEWVVRYSCSRHVAPACGMWPDASCGWNGQPSQWANPDWGACREHAGYAGTKGGFRD